MLLYVNGKYLKCLCSRLFLCEHRSRQVIFLSFVSASFPLLLLLCSLQRWSRDTFLLLLQTTERIRIALFPLPLLPPPLPILLVYALLLLHAADFLLLAWIDQLSHLGGLDVVKGTLGRFVQHNGVKNYVKKRNTRNFLQASSKTTILEKTYIPD